MDTPEDPQNKTETEGNIDPDRDQPVNPNQVHGDYIINKFSHCLDFFQSLREQGDYAPVAAYEDTEKNISMTALFQEDENAVISAEEAFDYLKKRMYEDLQNNKIISFIVLCHVMAFGDGKGCMPAKNIEQINALHITYKDKTIDAEGSMTMYYSDEQ